MSPARRRILRAGVATAVGVAILVGLGTWQLRRLAWKEALIARVAERMAEAPVPAPDRAAWPSLDLDAWEYRRVRLDGVFDHAKEARVFVNLSEPRGPLRGPGYFLLTPLALDGGGAVIVNRGFAPDGQTEAASRPSGRVSLTGVVRAPEQRNLFTPPDDAGERLFFDRDPKAIAAALGVPEAAPFTVDAEAQPGAGGLPQGGETRVAFPNRHLEYALTWFGLAAALAGVGLAVLWRRRRG